MAKLKALQSKVVSVQCFPSAQLDLAAEGYFSLQ